MKHQYWDEIHSLEHVDYISLFESQEDEMFLFLCLTMPCLHSLLFNGIGSCPSGERPGGLYNVDARGVSVSGPGEGGDGGEGGPAQVQHEDDH